MSDDLIRRSDAVVAIANLHVSHDKEEIFKAYAENPHSMTTDFEGTLIDAINAVEALPSADRPQGKWIRDRYWSRGVGMGEEYGFFYKCSLCEYEVENGYTRCGFNYCPYCGTYMREREDE